MEANRGEQDLHPRGKSPRYLPKGFRVRATKKTIDVFKRLLTILLMFSSTFWGPADCFGRWGTSNPYPSIDMLSGDLLKIPKPRRRSVLSAPARLIITTALYLPQIPTSPRDPSQLETSLVSS
jgi:hypothetical protein